MAALPRFIQIEPVGECNLRCRMCPIQFRRDGRPYGPPAFMAIDRYVEILDSFPGLHELHLQGLGEPLMHPRFFDMVALARERGIDVSVNTNLTLMTPRAADACVTSGLGHLYASIDGANAVTYERIRVRGSYDKVCRNLKRILDARARHASSTPKIDLVVVAMRENLDEIAAIVSQAGNWGVDAVNVQHLCHDFGESSLPSHYRPMREFVDEQTLLAEDPARVNEAFERARAAARAAGLPLRLPRFDGERKKDPRGCSWPSTGAYFSYDGEMMPCCMIATPDRFSFGNVGQTPAAALWNGSAYERFREQLASDHPPDICKSCALYAGTF